MNYSSHGAVEEVAPRVVVAAHSAPAIASQPRFSWKRFGGKFLVFSVAAHVLFLAVAAYFVVQTYSANHKQTFLPSAKGPNASTRAIEHQVQQKRMKNPASAPPAAKRVTTTNSNTNFVLPSMPAMPSMTASLSPTSISGMGASGVAPGAFGAGGGGGGGSGGGGSVNFFGITGGGGSGLEGTFHDFKVNASFQPIKGAGRVAFTKIVKDFAVLNGPWHIEATPPHYTSPAKLKAKYFFYPAIQDTEAGKAFQSPRSGPGSWLGLYKGTVSSPNGGTFRFVGWGDNVMIVKIDDKVVIDASDHGYTGMKRERIKNIVFPKKGGTAVFTGEYFHLPAGETKSIEIAVGDEGGIFCSGLMIQLQGMPLEQDKNGVPKVPLFVIGTINDADRRLLSEYLGPDSLRGPFFTTGTSTAASFFDRR